MHAAKEKLKGMLSGKKRKSRRGKYAGNKAYQNEIVREMKIHADECADDTIDTVERGNDRIVRHLDKCTDETQDMTKDFEERLMGRPGSSKECRLEIAVLREQEKEARDEEKTLRQRETERLKEQTNQRKKELKALEAQQAEHERAAKKLKGCRPDLGL